MAALAAEAKAEEPPSPPPAPEKRGAPAEGEEERPEAKRRRARVAALESVPRATAAAASEGDGCEGGSFSFHARSFSGVAETTPKFGSFNPAAAAQLVPFHLTPPPPLVDPDSPVVVDNEGKGKSGNSH
ncbi:hypothetical protein BRADI_2g21230v3 [Brachypodium distachyon]|uniref:Uncharacterized protein n=1 Tax=Brachypodium distachyon TaxID=15368 RepID=I1HI43_BRADI|nr:hypothetical protein BRADI_2g21230v3 [Brachypodium distachyon]